jgi:hypothetical protein
VGGARGRVGRGQAGHRGRAPPPLARSRLLCRRHCSAAATTHPYHRRRRALDKERLEGSLEQGNSGQAARASVVGAVAERADGEGGGPAAASAAPQPAAGGGGGGGGSLPPIFWTRPSARFGVSKPRPLYPKLDLLLDLVYRRLYFDPSQADSGFSADALLRAIRKIDKDLGP